MNEPVTFFLNGEPVEGEPFHYTMCGLQNIFLGNGFLVEEDPAYGKIVTVEHEDDLQRAIGVHILENEEMDGREFRFLRKQMGMTQEALAKWMDINVQTIANYEKGESIPGPSEALMRIAFAMYMFPEARADFLRAVMEHGETKRRPLPRRERNRIVRSWHEVTRAAA